MSDLISELFTALCTGLGEGNTNTDKLTRQILLPNPERDYNRTKIEIIEALRELKETGQIQIITMGWEFGEEFFTSVQGDYRMEKKQLIQKIAEGANITKAQAEKATTLLTQVLSTALKEGKKIPKYLIPESPADAPLWSSVFPFGTPLFVSRRAFLKEQYVRALKDYREALLEELKEIDQEIQELEKAEKENEKGG